MRSTPMTMQLGKSCGRWAAKLPLQAKKVTAYVLEVGNKPHNSPKETGLDVTVRIAQP